MQLSLLSGENFFSGFRPTPLLTARVITFSAFQNIREAVSDTPRAGFFWTGCFNEKKRIDTVRRISGLNLDELLSPNGAEPSEAPSTLEALILRFSSEEETPPPSEEDLLRILRENPGCSLYLFADASLEKIHHLEPLSRPESEEQKLDADHLIRFLDTGGALEQELPRFRPRSGQKALLRYIIDGFNEKLILSAEAGTGIGKSFAYLIPALQWAHRHDERVVISTSTHTLQDQLLKKDLPLIRKIMGLNISYSVMKGRGNFLCLYRLDAYAKEPELFQNDTLLPQIKDWAETGSTGLKDDCPVLIPFDVWENISCVPDFCGAGKCPFYNECFFFRAKKKAASSHILVINHHLLFADIAVSKDDPEISVLPSYKHLILDEAHHMERSAVSFFSLHLNKNLLLRLLTRLHPPRQQQNSSLFPEEEKPEEAKPKRSRSGLLRQRERYTGEDILGEASPKINRIFPLWEALEQYGLTLFTDQNREIPLPRESHPLLIRHLENLEQALNDLCLFLRELPILTRSEEENLLSVEIRQTEAGLKKLAHFCSLFGKQKNPDVFWADKQKNFELHISPVEIGGLLKEELYEKLDTAVHLSATLTVNGSFNYWHKMIGQNRLRRTHDSEIFPSPFDYRNHVLLAVPDNIPSPKEPADHESFLIDFLKTALLRTEGRGLILFTSYKMLQTVFEAVSPDLEKAGIPALLQKKTGNRSQILKQFCEETNSTLFGTDSFWEGIDAPGETLRIVVICKLPFRVPVHPVLQAKTERIRREGGNPFRELSLPEAVLKMKQGFGRLMRHETDRGAVVILDSRIRQAGYGRIFLDSLPPARYREGETESLLDEIERFSAPPAEVLP